MATTTGDLQASTHTVPVVTITPEAYEVVREAIESAMREAVDEARGEVVEQEQEPDPSRRRARVGGSLSGPWPSCTRVQSVAGRLRATRRQRRAHVACARSRAAHAVTSPS